MSELWINKYKPTKISQLIGKDKEILDISKWLNNIKDSKVQTLIISGHHGVGKSILIDILLKKFNYVPIIINQNDIKEYRNNGSLKDIFNCSNFENINNFTFKKRQALVFDGAESITLSSEKKYIMEIYKENNKSKVLPLIFITNLHHNKIINDIKKQALYVEIKFPSNNEIISMLSHVCKKENINIKKSAVDLLIKYSEKDLRKLLYLFQELSNNFNNKVIDCKELTKFLNSSKKKNQDISLFDATKMIISNHLEYDIIKKLYEIEKVLLPLMIHENYPLKILKDSDNNLKTNLYNMIKISDSISRGDNIETSIYTDQNWFLQNIHGFFTCINPNFWINKNSSTDIKTINFSKDLNKTSLKNINRKNINNIKRLVGKKSIEEILMMVKLANKLFNSGKINIFVDILKTYKNNITIKDVELFIKIDKTYDFNLFTTKQKKVIEKLL
tara:strand:+ start:2923 stop:4260 length:1338 start_codon:yes stop_codon:yes gene_type:complete